MASIRFLAAILLASGSLTACSKPHVVARVGDYEITDRDTAYRNRLIILEYPQELRDLGLKQLVDAYAYAQILKIHDRAITSAQIEEEANRIQSHTQMPDKLAEIQKLFGLDHESYLKVYVLPVYATRVLPFEFFPNHSEFQEKYLSLALDALKTLKTAPRAFSDVAARLKIPIHRYLLNASGVQVDGKPMRSKLLHSTVTEPDPLKAEVEQLAHRQPHAPYFNRLFEVSDGWLILRPVSVAPESVRLEGMHIRKIDFQDWLGQELPKIRVRYLDSQ